MLKTWMQGRASGILAAGLLSVAAVAATVAIPACGKTEGEKALYHCPMHPTYTSDHPGDCPICNMRLVKVEAEPASPSSGPEDGSGPHAGHGSSASPRPPRAAAPPAPGPGQPTVPSAQTDQGHAEIRITAEGRAQAGVQVAEARKRKLIRRVRTVGSVVSDERRVRQVHTRIDGWVEKLYVNFTGQPVQEGEPLLAIYSPELLASQEQYVQLLSANAGELAAAARKRLELFGVPESFIVELEKTGKPRRTVTLYSPVAGFVTEKEVYEGQRVEPEMELLVVTDLSHVWIEAVVYEADASLVRVGQEAGITLPYEAGAKLNAKVTYVDPALDPESRTLKVRLEHHNPDLRLKLGMFVDVVLDVGTLEGLAVPDTAIVDTGNRKLVYQDLGDGKFAPREVEVGFRTGGWALVESGLKAGDKVAVKGNFLLDSESRIRGSLPGAVGGEHAGHGGAPAGKDAQP